MHWDVATLKDLEEKIWRCSACGTCKAAYEYGPPPRSNTICPAGVEYGFEGYLASKGKIGYARGILDGQLEWDEELVDAVYACTVCGGCQAQCQLDHKPFIPEIIEAIRRDAVAAGAGPMPSQKVVTQSLGTYDNPYQGARRVRTDWTRPFKKAGRPIQDIQKHPASILFWAGCTGAYNAEARVIPTATASIFQKLGLDFGMLGEQELCCGSTAMRLGDVAAFQELAERNMAVFKQLHEEQGVTTIVTSCAGCYRAMTKDYSLADEYEEALSGINIVHTTDFLYGMLKTGELPLSVEVNRTVTYHDPCHAGRHLTEYRIDEHGTEQYEGAYLGEDQSQCVYEQPRELLQAIPGLKFREMQRVRQNSFCCGGGGGVMTGYKDWATRNAGLRVEEAMETEAEQLVSICPFCFVNLSEAAANAGGKMSVVDITQLIDEALPAAP